MQEWVTAFTAQFHSSSRPVTDKIVLCPPFAQIPSLRPLTDEPSIALGVQDISPFPAGSYTGAIGTKNLEGLGVQFAIVGHSERRRYFHETSQDVAMKVSECLAAGITPIVCVTKEQINEQANLLKEEERNKVLVAFEPIEHIGTGTSDTLAHILETKDWVLKAFGTVPYIYGGSVNPQTDPAILQSDKIDGFLVGSASLDPNSFFDLLMHI